MTKEEYIEHIMEAVNKIDNLKFLNRILNCAMKHLVKSRK